MAGALGLAGELPFKQILTACAAQYVFDAGRAKDAAFALEFLSSPDLLKRGVRLDGEQASSVEKAPFEKRANVEMLTFGEGAERIFVVLKPNAIIAASEEKNVVSWRLEPPRGCTSFSIEFCATNAKETAAANAHIARAMEAEKREQLGAAAALYAGFSARFPLLKRECDAAAARLSVVNRDIEKLLADVERIIAQARTRRAMIELNRAAGAVAALHAKLPNDERVAKFVAAVAELRAEIAADAERATAARAAQLLAAAKRQISDGQTLTARGTLEQIIKDYANTAAAVEAKNLLEQLPNE